MHFFCKNGKFTYNSYFTDQNVQMLIIKVKKTQQIPYFSQKTTILQNNEIIPYMELDGNFTQKWKIHI